MQSKKKRILGIVAALLLMLAAPMNGMSADQKVYKLKFSWNDIWGPKFRASQIYRPGGEMERMLYERSGGRIQLEIIPRMFPSGDMFTAVAKGKADMGDIAMPWLSGTYPIWNWGEIPGIVNEDPVKGLAEELAVYQDPEVMKIYDKTLKKFGLKFWFVTQWDPANGIWSNRNITTLEDLKGMKVRVGGYLPTQGIKELGASPVTIAGSELAPAMMAGTIDGVLTSLGYGYSIGLGKVSKYFTLTPLSPTWTAVTLMNAKSFEALPEDLQKVVMDVGRELQQMVSLSTTAEYVMSLDTVDLSGVKRTRLEAGDAEQIAQAAAAVEKEWLNVEGPWKEERPALLKAVKNAVQNYRDFTGK
ncbi:TRAP transporter substrate-binding protein DctP [Desulforhopalus singaporensis]|uniref:TRAP-type C4-dicarboxylate transport system, substrate-binding protein n=1 Tax=Desulforhopalus singaporensis TaxID=91360 RepID=A0A1H0N7I5_9BACT|nr:TRAP transporter substrate-binding protein DctP [Desulforhopalus singaporensis]SDO88643.1 TRAP-type C4-dicarboxylate transport system, substrate-binding protein [Desulforhopalus singaporensis]